MRRVFYITVILCVYSILLNAQKRVDGADIVKISKQSQIVSSIVGWCYDKTYHKWCGYYNVIWPEFKNNNKTPKYPPSFFYEYNDEDVLNMQMKMLKYKGENIYMLYISQLDHYYDYPSINEGYHSYKEKTVFFMKQEEYDKLWNLEVGINKIRLLNETCSFGHYKSTYDNQSEMLAYKFGDDGFSLNYRTYANSKFEPLTWYIKKEDDGTIRFQFPTNKGLLEDAIEYNKKLPKSATHFDIRSERDAKDFSTEYYEISNVNFQKLKIK